MINEETLRQFEAFLRQFHLNETLIKKLMNYALRSSLPSPERLKKELNVIGSVFRTQETLNLFILEYKSRFSPEDFHKPKRMSESELNFKRFCLKMENEK